MPAESYVFAERTYEHLARAGIGPLAVMDVLYSSPVVRRHIGASLQIAGRDRDGVWLVVALVEDHDDQYTVTGARLLDADEIDVVSRLLREDHEQIRQGHR